MNNKSLSKLTEVQEETDGYHNTRTFTHLSKWQNRQQISMGGENVTLTN